MQLNSILQSAALTLLLLALQPHYAIAESTVASDYKDGDRLQPQSAAKSSYKTIKDWDALMPKGWDPTKDFQKIDFSKMNDSDPRAQKALQRLRDAWKNAPVAPGMNGARIRIPGFIVPLEEAHHQISEFLLVPYFGGCIHVPPPPSNQITCISSGWTFLYSTAAQLGLSRSLIIFLSKTTSPFRTKVSFPFRASPSEWMVFVVI